MKSPHWTSQDQKFASALKIKLDDAETVIGHRQFVDEKSTITQLESELKAAAEDVRGVIDRNKLLAMDLQELRLERDRIGLERDHWQNKATELERTLEHYDTGDTVPRCDYDALGFSHQQIVRHMGEAVREARWWRLTAIVLGIALAFSVGRWVVLVGWER